MCFLSAVLFYSVVGDKRSCHYLFFHYTAFNYFDSYFDMCNI